MAEYRGVSYQLRVRAVNAVYDRWVKSGLSNREIWRRYIYPRFGISERTMYYMLKASSSSFAPLPRSCELDLFSRDLSGPAVSLGELGKEAGDE